MQACASMCVYMPWAMMLDQGLLDLRLELELELGAGSGSWGKREDWGLGKIGGIGMDWIGMDIKHI